MSNDRSDADAFVRSFSDEELASIMEANDEGSRDWMFAQQELARRHTSIGMKMLRLSLQVAIMAALGLAAWTVIGWVTNSG